MELAHHVLQREANPIVDELQLVRHSSGKKVTLALVLGQVASMPLRSLAGEVVEDDHRLASSSFGLGGDLLDLLARVVLALALVVPGLGLEGHVDVLVPCVALFLRYPQPCAGAT